MGKITFRFLTDLTMGVPQKRERPKKESIPGELTGTLLGTLPALGIGASQHDLIKKKKDFN